MQKEAYHADGTPDESEALAHALWRGLQSRRTSLIFTVALVTEGISCITTHTRVPILRADRVPGERLPRFSFFTHGRATKTSLSHLFAISKAIAAEVITVFAESARLVRDAVILDEDMSDAQSTKIRDYFFTATALLSLADIQVP